MQKTIYDIGMHTGRDTAFYLQKGFRVVAVEANPALVEKAKTTFTKELASGQLTIVEKAIAPENVTEIEFYINSDKDDWGTIMTDWNRGMNSNYKTIKVAATGLDAIIKEHGVPYYIKIDIEGADALCLKSLLKLNTRPEYISVELLTPNNLKNKNVDGLELLCYLYALGYRKFQISDQSKNESVKCPNPALEGQYTDFAFGGDTSGLFGRELKSKAFSIDELSGMYLDYFYKQLQPQNIFQKVFNKIVRPSRQQVFHAGGWFDVHASR